MVTLFENGARVQIVGAGPRDNGRTGTVVDGTVWINSSNPAALADRAVRMDDTGEVLRWEGFFLAGLTSSSTPSSPVLCGEHGQPLRSDRGPATCPSGCLLTWSDLTVNGSGDVGDVVYVQDGAVLVRLAD